MEAIKTIDKDKMALSYIEMGDINIAISEEYMQVEGVEFMKLEEKMNG